jgi:hypothetical protein
MDYQENYRQAQAQAQAQARVQAQAEAQAQAQAQANSTVYTPPRGARGTVECCAISLVSLPVEAGIALCERVLTTC